MRSDHPLDIIRQGAMPCMRACVMRAIVGEHSRDDRVSRHKAGIIAVTRYRITKRIVSFDTL